MFDESQKLIVVYKDELVLNMLRKFVDTYDDIGEKIVGTKDGSISIIAWDEKTWLDQKKAGNIASKILFIGDIKGNNNLLPLIDVKYNKWGIKYGWAGKQAIILVDESAVGKRTEYEKFLEEFKNASVPILPREEEKEKLSKALVIGGTLASAFSFVGLIGAGVSYAFDYFKDKKIVRQQLYLFGIAELYKNHLETFMQS